MKLGLLAAGVLLGAAALPTVAAAEYPERTVTIVVPVSAGGGTDTGTRTWAPFLEQCLGGRQPVIVVNMPGAAGVVGFSHIAQQPADGYTLGLMLMPNLSTAIVANKQINFKLDSFEFLWTYFGNSLGIAVRKDSGLKTIDDFLALAQKEPVNVGVTGIGNDDFLLVDQMKRQTGGQFVQIPLDGTAGLVPALAGGHVPVGIMTMASVATNSEQIRPLASATAGRMKDFPDLPTLREKGVDIVSQSAHVIGAPKGLPQDVRDKLTACFAQIATNADFQEQARKRSLPPLPMNAEETTSYMVDETDRLQTLWEKDPWL